MGVLDQEKADRIKQLLKWHPRGLTITDISSQVKMNRNLVAKYLDMLLISGQVEMQVIGAAKVYFLCHRVPISAMLEFSSDLVIVVDSEKRILQVNEQVLTLLNEKRDSVIGKKIHETGNLFIDCLPVPDLPKDPREAGEHISEITPMLKGETRHFQVKQVPTAFEDGSQGITLLIEDVTEQKEGFRLRDLLASIVLSSGEAIIGKTPEGGIASWNPAAERLYGYSQEEVLGKPFQMLVPQDLQGDLDILLKRVWQGDCIQRYEMKMVRKDGVVMDVLITISPI